MNASREDVTPGSAALTPYGRASILAAAFLAWMFAGVTMGLFPLAGRPATIALMGAVDEGIVGAWFSYYTCAFLFGAAAGGLLFGWLGDRYGRVRALAWSVICFTGFTALCAWAKTPEQLTVLRFLACLGVGGAWPNGIALASEAWPEVSRPTLAGLFGTAANVGIVGIAVWGIWYPVTRDNWTTSMLVWATPLPLGVLIWLLVPESPKWLAARSERPQSGRSVGMLTVFDPAYLRLTLVGIALGTIPLFGNWSSGNWLIPWADKAAEQAHLQSKTADANASSAPKAAGPDAKRKAWTQLARSSGATFGSLIGGWLASMLGRRLVYFFISLGSWAISAYIFSYLNPLDAHFLYWVFALGFVTTIYFGWLPLFLPELFPTEVRSTGAGVTFNFGRIVAAFGVLSAGWMMELLGGDYARALAITSLVYILGMVVIWLAPDTSRKRLGV